MTYGLLILISICIGIVASDDTTVLKETPSANDKSDATTPSPKDDITTAAIEVINEVLKLNENSTSINGTDPDGVNDDTWTFENTTIIDTRRILYSQKVGCGKRPYMVYLQLTKESAKIHRYRGWLCAGVIVDQFYVLTSAACVEDADKFYIVSGTTKFVDSFDYKKDECACKNRRKVVWKCIPKNYKFDFQDSIKWSSNDIAVVKVDKPFKFGITERGCEFATDLICYNNISRELEKPGTKGFIAGWGSGHNFREGVYRRQDVHIPKNSPCLQEAKVCIMDNEQCAKKWAQKFREIITTYMICTRDVEKRLSEICANHATVLRTRFNIVREQEKQYANCTDIETRRDIEYSDLGPNDNHLIDVGRHLRDPDDIANRRATKLGGFCENDHGGPLIVKYRGKDRVIGVISACKIDPKSHSCHGPFLYTSVFKNQQFLACAIHKDIEESCRRVFRTGITHEEITVDWDGTEDVETGEKAELPEEKAPEAEKEIAKTLKKREIGDEKDTRREVFYESSRDEAVNEPEEDE